MSTEPLATYTERLLEVRREFVLYDDRVVVRARWLPNRKFEHVVRLAALRADFEEITIRYRMYRYAGWIIALGALAFAVSTYSAPNAAIGIIGYGGLGILLCGAVLLAVAYPHRRIRFARFHTHAGPAGFDIGSAGNDAATFEGFVRQVRRQIRK